MSPRRTGNSKRAIGCSTVAVRKPSSDVTPTSRSTKVIHKKAIEAPKNASSTTPKTGKPNISVQSVKLVESTNTYDLRKKLMRDVRRRAETPTKPSSHSPVGRKRTVSDGVAAEEMSKSKRARMRRIMRIVGVEGDVETMMKKYAGGKARNRRLDDKEENKENREWLRHRPYVPNNIARINFNSHFIPTNYEAPYTDAVIRQHLLPLCEWCLEPQRDMVQLGRHKLTCTRHHPPGNEIYRHGRLAVFEVDGKHNRVYCQYLCLLGKLFIESKTAHLNVEEFHFYVVVELSAEGYHAIGYFSKEKESAMDYNLSCILTLPPYQGRGIGRFMIDFSYLLARTDGLVGTPEHPISDQGLAAYRAYWRCVILEHLGQLDKENEEGGGQFSVSDLSDLTGIHPDDIVSSLQTLYMIKYYRGKHMLYLNPTVLKQFAVESKARREHIAKFKFIDRCEPGRLQWPGHTDKVKSGEANRIPS